MMAVYRIVMMQNVTVVFGMGVENFTEVEFV